MTMEQVDFWDLDHTLLNTERKLFGPVLDGLAKKVGRERRFVDQMFDQANQTTFTFAFFFELIGVSAGEREKLEEEIRSHVALKAESCLYPGIVDLLEERKRVAQQVLVTGGNVTYQEWKFSTLKVLHGIFAPEDRHFVPLNGSKGARVAQYHSRARGRFIDDSARWHKEVAGVVSGLEHIRPIWPDTLGAEDHPDDGRLWQTARSAEELRVLLDADAL